MLRWALKEWAVICRALADGRQSLLLRKGGVAESGGVFQVEQPRLWLLPTYVHQQEDGILEAARPLLARVKEERPPQGVLRLTHFAEVVAAWVVQDLERVLRLAELHLWSEETIRSRFAYRRPGLHVLLVRVFRATQPVETEDRPEYAGCRSWVDLGRDWPTEGSVPVLDDGGFEGILSTVGRLMHPNALA
jgi:hypothetical protein